MNYGRSQLAFIQKLTWLRENVLFSLFSGDSLPAKREQSDSSTDWTSGADVASVCRPDGLIHTRVELHV